jgi:glycosyltransferase involved in cell wall biosynthesis
MNKEAPLGVIYWGKKGGGNRFTMNMILELQSKMIPFELSLSRDNEMLSSYEARFLSDIHYFNLRTTLRHLPSSMLKKRNEVNRIFREFNSIGVESVVIAMPHIFDFGAHRAAKENSISLIRIMHDHKRHPGDFWPNKLSLTLRRCASDKLIFLSNFVRNKSLWPKKPNLVLDFPKEHLVSNIQVSNQSNNKWDVVIIGRIRKYKGIEQIDKIVKTTNIERRTSFLIAGSGKIRIKESNLVSIENKWLSEIEFEETLHKSGVVLMLHTEASQSGVPSIATKLRKWVVAPNLGGLPEQITEGQNGFLYSPGDINSMALAISKAIRAVESGKFPSESKKDSFTNSLMRIVQ